MSVLLNQYYDLAHVTAYDTRREMGRAAAKEAAERINAVIEKKGSANVIFAAAPSQNEFLEELLCTDVRFDCINAFHLDEYVGISPDAPQGFARFLRDRLFDRAPFRQVFCLDCTAPDPQAECERYAALLRQYPADFICFGIGENGHLAFNDPPVADAQDPYIVKIVELDPLCRQQQVNDGCFASLELVPTHAYTVTLPTLLGAGGSVVIVPGETKTKIVGRVFTGEIGTDAPASLLRRVEGCHVYLDAASAQLLL